MREPSVVLTALGMVNALGHETETIWNRLRRGDQTGLTLQSGFVNKKRTRVGAFHGPWAPFPKHLESYRCRNNALLLQAFQEIAPQVRVAIQTYGTSRIGVVLGSSTSGMAATETAYRAWRRTGTLPKDFHYIQHEMGGVAEFLARLSGVDGPAYTLSTACSSSAKVFASARALIRQGWCDAVLVGGADSLCQLTVQGFTALGALSPDACNSMSRNRNGFTIGEGAALFLMERSGGDIQLAGVGETSDAYHLSAPDPTGKGAWGAMRLALREACLSPKDIDFVHLHGTGTPLNDQMESRAVARLFPDTPVSSSKGMVGHTLGASGVMGVGFLWLAMTHLQKGRMPLPPHCWDGKRDKSLPALPLVTVGKTLPVQGSLALVSNSFGFGGSNCSVILRKDAPCR